MRRIQLVGLLLIIGAMFTFTSCEEDDEMTAVINTTQTNASGDVSGDGGSISKTWTFTNSNLSAGWDMSINASRGSFQLVLIDAAGTVLLDKTLTGGSGPQSADGTTPEGTAGEWTATVTLVNFNGIGDYSFL